MATETRAVAHRPRAGWLPRAVVSGFTASIVMSMTFFVAYGIARIATNLELAPRRGAATLHEWIVALTNNQVLDLATTSLYAAGTVHLVVSVLWAMLYAYYFEPRLFGAGWLRGVIFSTIPWVLSLLVFLPVVGGGFFGAAIGAGPLPAIGNLILHLAYGATLGTIYGPLGDIPADEFPRRGTIDEPQVVAQYELAAAKGILFGAVIGAVLGAVGSANSSLQMMLGLPGLALLPVTVVLGASFGVLVGSIAGLSSEQSR